MIYQLGIGVEKNIASAIACFEHAAGLGYLRTYNFLATIYGNLKDRPQFQNAFRYNYRVIKTINPDKRLGDLNINSDSSQASTNVFQEVNKTQGFLGELHKSLGFSAHLDEDSKKALVSSIYNLGQLYIEGLGCPKDEKLGWDMLGLAGGLGHDGARLYWLREQALLGGEMSIIFEGIHDIAKKGK